MSATEALLALLNRDPASVRLEYGTVTAISPDLLVRLDVEETAVEIQRLASASALAVDDRVAVLVSSGDRLVIGELA